MSITRLNYATEIVPGLWVSGKRHALDKSFLRTKNIKTVINVTNSVPFLSADRYNYRIGIDDAPDQNGIMYRMLFETIELIEQSLEAHRPVLCHCSQGISRSCSVIAAYLIRKFPEKSIDQIIEYIKEKRNVAFALGENFRPALEKYRTKLQH